MAEGKRPHLQTDHRATLSHKSIGRRAALAHWTHLPCVQDEARLSWSADGGSPPGGAWRAFERRESFIVGTTAADYSMGENRPGAKSERIIIRVRIAAPCFFRPSVTIHTVIAGAAKPSNISCGNLKSEDIATQHRDQYRTVIAGCKSTAGAGYASARTTPDVIGDPPDGFIHNGGTLTWKGGATTTIAQASYSSIDASISLIRTVRSITKSLPIWRWRR